MHSILAGKFVFFEVSGEVHDGYSLWCLVRCMMGILWFLFEGSVTDRPPGPPSSGRKGEMRPVYNVCV